GALLVDLGGTPPGVTVCDDRAGGQAFSCSCRRPAMSIQAPARCSRRSISGRLVSVSALWRMRAALLSACCMVRGCSVTGFASRGEDAAGCECEEGEACAEEGVGPCLADGVPDGGDEEGEGCEESEESEGVHAVSCPAVITVRACMSCNNSAPM